MRVDALALHHRHHRHAGAGIIVGAIQRQRPEMRRRPQEDDGTSTSGASARLPVTAAQPIAGGKRAREAADDDVLRRAALQPERIDADIEEDGEGEQRRGQRD